MSKEVSRCSGLVTAGVLLNLTELIGFWVSGRSSDIALKITSQLKKKTIWPRGCAIVRTCYEINHPQIYSKYKAMAPHSSTLAWKIPWTEEPGRLQSMGSLRVGHD